MKSRAGYEEFAACKGETRNGYTIKDETNGWL
jgi:hypothetical protein